MNISFDKDTTFAYDSEALAISVWSKKHSNVHYKFQCDIQFLDIYQVKMFHDMLGCIIGIKES